MLQSTCKTVQVKKSLQNSLSYTVFDLSRICQISQMLNITLVRKAAVFCFQSRLPVDWVNNVKSYW